MFFSTVGRALRCASNGPGRYRRGQVLFGRMVLRHSLRRCLRLRLCLRGLAMIRAGRRCCRGRRSPLHRTRPDFIRLPRGRCVGAARIGRRCGLLAVRAIAACRAAGAQTRMRFVTTLGWRRDDCRRGERGGCRGCQGCRRWPCRHGRRLGVRCDPLFGDTGRLCGGGRAGRQCPSLRLCSGGLGRPGGRPRSRCDCCVQRVGGGRLCRGERFRLRCRRRGTCRRAYRCCDLSGQPMSRDRWLRRSLFRERGRYRLARRSRSACRGALRIGHRRGPVCRFAAWRNGRRAVMRRRAADGALGVGGILVAYGIELLSKQIDERRRRERLQSRA